MAIVYQQKSELRRSLNPATKVLLNHDVVAIEEHGEIIAAILPWAGVRCQGGVVEANPMHSQMVRDARELMGECWKGVEMRRVGKPQRVNAASLRDAFGSRLGEVTEHGAAITFTNALTPIGLIVPRVFVRHIAGEQPDPMTRSRVDQAIKAVLETEKLFHDVRYGGIDQKNALRAYLGPLKSPTPSPSHT